MVFASSISLVPSSVQLADDDDVWASWSSCMGVEISVVSWMFLLVLSLPLPVSWYSVVTLVLFVSVGLMV